MTRAGKLSWVDLNMRVLSRFELKAEMYSKSMIEDDNDKYQEKRACGNKENVPVTVGWEKYKALQ